MKMDMIQTIADVGWLVMVFVGLGIFTAWIKWIIKQAKSKEVKDNYDGHDDI